MLASLAASILNRKRGKRAPDPASCRRFLFLQYETPLGASILATPIFEALKAAIPDAHVTVACDDTAYRVLGNNPHVDAIVRTANPVSQLPRALWQFFSRVTLRFDRWDCAVTDVSNRRTPVALLSLLAPVKLRAGFPPAGVRYDISLDYDFEAGVLANNMRIVEALGHTAKSCEPALFFTRQDAAVAQDFLEAHAIAADEPIVAVASQFSGGYPEKRGWQDARFAETADRLVREHHCRIVFLGTAAEGRGIEAIRSLMTAASVSAAGSFDIPQLAAFLTQCDLLLTLDTGTLHVARAVGTSALVIARPWQPPREWLPVGVKGYTILMKQDIVERCRDDPGFDVPATIDEVSVDEVVSAATSLLRNGRVSAESRAARLAARLRR